MTKHQRAQVVLKAIKRFERDVKKYGEARSPYTCLLLERYSHSTREWYVKLWKDPPHIGEWAERLWREPPVEKLEHRRMMLALAHTLALDGFE